MLNVTATQIKRTRRNSTDIYSRVFSTRISHYISAFCIRRGISANQVTRAMLWVGLPSAACLTSQSIIVGIIGWLGLMLVSIFDSCDGEIARHLKTFSLKGVYLDKIIQSVVDIATPTALSIRFYQIGPRYLWLIPLLYLIFNLLDVLAKEIYAAVNQSNNSSLKQTKLSIGYDRKSIFHFICHITASTSALYFNIGWIIAIDWVIGRIIEQTFYYFEIGFLFYLCFMQIIKFLYRSNKICNLLDRQ